MIALDIHVHLIGTDFETHGCWVSPRWRKNPIFKLWRRHLGIPSGMSDFDADRKLLADLAFAVGACSHLDGAVILANDGVYDASGRLDKQRSRLVVGNDYVLAAAKRYSFFYPGVSVNPLRRDWREELDKAAAGGAVLVKLVPNYLGIDLSDKRLLPYWRYLREHSLPLLTHGGFEHVLKAADQRLGDPALLRPALDEGVTVIVAHAASSGVAHPFKEYFWNWTAMLPRYPDLYGDLSAFCNVARKKYLKYFVADETLMSRALQGSDWPVPISPFLFWRDIPRPRLKQIRTLKNYFAQECELKLAAGVPREVFYRAAKLLNIVAGSKTGN